MRIVTVAEYGEITPLLERERFTSAFSEDGMPYWCHEDCIEFRQAEVDRLMAAAESVYGAMRDALQAHIAHPDFLRRLGFDELTGQRILQSHQRGERSLHGRFDFGVSPDGSIKLFEYNGDPLGMQFASGHFQPLWLDEMKRSGRLPPGARQYAALQSHLVRAMARLDPGLPLHVLYEDADYGSECNARFLANAACAAGLDARKTDCATVRVDSRGRLRDCDGERIQQVVNLMSWRWIESLASPHPLPELKWHDPLWTRVFANKAFLPFLWRHAPDNPHLLPTFGPEERSSLQAGRLYAFKSPLGIIGRAVSIARPEEVPQRYVGADWIAQEVMDASVEDWFMTVSVWIVDGRPVPGLGVRGTRYPVNDEGCYFFPHYIVD